MGLVAVLGKALDEGMEDGDIDGPNMGGSGVLIHPGLEEGLKSEGVMDAIQVGIREAQLGELLAHSSEGFLHAFSSNGVCAVREESSVVPAGVDNEPVEV